MRRVGGVFKNPLLLTSSRQGRREPKPNSGSLSLTSGEEGA